MGKILNENNKYPLILVMIVILFVLAVGTAIFFSEVKFEKKVNGTVATILNDGDLVINYVDGNEVSFSDNKEHCFGITLTNSGTNKIYYSISFSSANKNDISIVLKDEDGKVISSLDEDIVNNKIVNLSSIEGEETVRYTVVLKNKEKDNTTFKGILKVVNESISTQFFSDIILMNNNISSIKTRLGTDVATSNEGLIKGSDNKGVSYYFRGDVDNNYVKLGDYLFRIVRINGDSTVRLVLDGVLPDKYAFNSNTAVGEGQDITSLVLLHNTTLKSVLDAWLQNDLKEYTTFITDGEFCTDVSFTNTINGINYSSAYDRVFKDRAPDLVCNGTVINNKVGLLSVDEVILAGAADVQENKKYYLYNEDIDGNYLTMSSLALNSSNHLSMMSILNNGGINREGDLITTLSNIRPVINIGVSAKVKGNGTKGDPYIIVS